VDIGVLAQVDEQASPQVEKIMRESGAHDVQRLEETRRINSRAWAAFVAIVAALVIVAAGISLPFFYDVLRIPFPSQMVEQESIGYEQGPRLAAPAEAVPVQGPFSSPVQPASSSFPATADSLQRGKVLYNLHCFVCHGITGVGDGRLSGFFVPKPVDLTSAQSAIR